MMTCEEFEQELLRTLTHLKDPDYRPPESLSVVLGCDPKMGAFAVQAAITRAIGELKPAPDVPPDAHPRRVYDLLYNRFVLRLTQEENAERLHISVATAWRMQREAIHALAMHIWQHRSSQQQPAEKTSDKQAAEWRAQAERELAALQALAPDSVTDIAEAIADVANLWNFSALGKDVRLSVAFIQPGLIATVHPAALSQFLLAAVRRLAGYTSSGEIRAFAALEEGNVVITLTVPLTNGVPADTDDLTRNFLAPEGVSIKAQLDGCHLFWRAELPSSGRTTVLVVDDNPDMADFYRRATEGTRYHIVHVARGQSLLETVKTTVPDVIVLDIMLPDIDGWKLLMRLHEDPATRSIPVIVCSVVREEALALSLGATTYLMKPVRPREFVQALDRCCCGL